jgi:hypothetical protein
MSGKVLALEVELALDVMAVLVVVRVELVLQAAASLLKACFIGVVMPVQSAAQSVQECCERIAGGGAKVG